MPVVVLAHATFVTTMSGRCYTESKIFKMDIMWLLGWSGQLFACPNQKRTLSADILPLKMWVSSICFDSATIFTLLGGGGMQPTNGFPTFNLSTDRRKYFQHEKSQYFT